MSDRDGNSSANEPTKKATIAIKNYPDYTEMRKNLQTHVVEDLASREPKQTQRRDQSSFNEVTAIELPLYENNIATEERNTLERVDNVIETETIVLDLSLDLAGSSHVDKAGSIENPYETNRAYDPPYETRKRKSSLAGSFSSNDDDNDSHKKRLKCLQYIGLFVCATFLTIFVIYYGSEHEGVRVFGGLSKLSRDNDLINTYYNIIDTTITEILLKSPNPERNEENVNGQLETTRRTFGR